MYETLTHGSVVKVSALKDLRFDYVILGGGITGLCIASRLSEIEKNAEIAIIDKEKEVGKHSSGRNSGIIHSGIYYKPQSLRSKVCVKGGIRLKAWINERKIPINNCGKIVVAQKQELDDQLEMLKKWGDANGAQTEIWGKDKLKRIFPAARTSSQRCLWCPETSVVNPKKVVKALYEELKEKNVIFFLDESVVEADISKNKIYLSKSGPVAYGYLFNCAGTGTLEIASYFGIGKEFTVMPFKGYYYSLKKQSNIEVPANLYPVANTETPFLGVHFTPGPEVGDEVSLGPTAILSPGRENYRGIDNLEPGDFAKNISILARSYILNKNKIRRYIHEQAFLNIKALFVKNAQMLVPQLEEKDLEFKGKVGIRPQLYDIKNDKLVDDFVCRHTQNTTHVLNTISPAFTSSFELADYIIAEAFPEKLPRVI